MSCDLSQLIPLPANSSAVETLSATPGTVLAIPIPQPSNVSGRLGRPRGLQIWFEDGSGFVSGRYGLFAGKSAPSFGGPIAADDGSLGVCPPFPQERVIDEQMTFVLVASATASAVCSITWLYDR